MSNTFIERKGIKRRERTQRSKKDEYTDYFNKGTYGYFNDLSENGIVFYVKAV